MDYDIVNSDIETEEIHHEKEISLFDKSPVSIGEFNTLFLGLVDRLALPDTHSEILLEFIRAIVPRSNNLTTSYHKIKQSKNSSSSLYFNEFKLCSVCNSKLKQTDCESSTCLYNRLTKRKYIHVVISNIKFQIEQIITNNYDSLVKYKSKKLVYILLFI